MVRLSATPILPTYMTLEYYRLRVNGKDKQTALTLAADHAFRECEADGFPPPQECGQIYHFPTYKTRPALLHAVREHLEGMWTPKHQNCKCTPLEDL